MCYSALVNQHVKSLGLTYKARIQLDLFEELFVDRVAGSGAKIPRALENAFLEKPETFAERRIEKAIRDYRAAEVEKMRADLGAQEKRLIAAEKTLLTKVTKKAQNDQRIAGNKIESLTAKIARIDSTELYEGDSRIYPGQYAPLIVSEAGERVIRPFRYHLRPRGQGPEFDRKFDGNYNARRDRLSEVFWWKSVFGKNHGLLPIKAFFENVARGDENVVLRFEPRDLGEMIVPCIFDRNEEGPFTLDSFALITDEPNPEVAAAGHDRTPIILREKYIDLWLLTDGKPLSAFEPALGDKQPTYFDHAVAA